MHKNILFLAKLQGKLRPFWCGQVQIYPLHYLLHVGVMLTIIKVIEGGDAFWDYTQEHLFFARDEKVCPFVKFEIVPPLLYCLWDPLTNKHCRAWSSMINLWIVSKTCQKHRILLQARRRSNILRTAFKRKCFREYKAVTLIMLYLKILQDMVSQNY